MNSFILKIIGLVLSLTVVGGSAYYYVSTKSKNENYTLGKAVDKITGNVEKTDFVLPENRKCIVDNTVDSQFGKVRISSTMYVTEGRISTMSEMDSMGKVVKSGVIIKDNVTYMWSSASDKIGAKITAKAGESLVDSYKKSTEKTYTSCSAWQIDDSVFALPSEIEFRELGK